MDKNLIDILTDSNIKPNNNNLASIVNYEDAINKITYINKDKINSSKFINLLSVDNQENEIILNFSSDITVKLLIEKIEIYLDDLDMPWPTGKKPMHK